MFANGIKNKKRVERETKEATHRKDESLNE